MRLFGSDRIAKMMDRMGLEEGEVIQHSMITKSIERAQKKIEENNFGIRKRLLEYDDVMNAQRTVIYKKRKHALFGERLAVDIDNMIYDTSESIVNEYQTLQDFEGFKLEIIRFLSVDCPVEESEFKSLKSEELTTKIYQNAITNYKTKSEVISQKTYPVIKDVYENQSATYQNIVIPFTDGLKTLQVVTNLKEAFESEGGNIPLSIEKPSEKFNIKNPSKKSSRVNSSKKDSSSWLDSDLIWRFNLSDLNKPNPSRFVIDFNEPGNWMFKSEKLKPNFPLCDKKLSKLIFSKLVFPSFRFLISKSFIKISEEFSWLLSKFSLDVTSPFLKASISKWSLWEITEFKRFSSSSISSPSNNTALEYLKFSSFTLTPKRLGSTFADWYVRESSKKYSLIFSVP